MFAPNLGLSVRLGRSRSPNNAMGKGPHVAHQNDHGYQFSLTDKEFFESFRGFLRTLANFAAGEFAPSEARRFPKGSLSRRRPLSPLNPNLNDPCQSLLSQSLPQDLLLGEGDPPRSDELIGLMPLARQQDDIPRLGFLHQHMDGGLAVGLP